MVIIAALSIEIAPLLNALKAEKIKAYSNKTGLYRAGETDLLISGVGPIMAERTLRAYLEDNRPSFIINIGTAGIMRENLILGDIYHVGACLTENEAPISLHMLVDEPGVRCLSLRRSIENSGYRDQKQKKYQADIADMECYTLAAVALEKGIPISAIKITTDFADCETADMFKEQIKNAAIKLANETIHLIKS